MSQGAVRAANDGGGEGEEELAEGIAETGGKAVGSVDEEQSVDIMGMFDGVLEGDHHTERPSTEQEVGELFFFDDGFEVSDVIGDAKACFVGGSCGVKATA